MKLLDEKQRVVALKLLDEYETALPDAEGQTPRQRGETLDQERERIINETFRPLIQSYLSGAIPLETFKITNDGLNKRYEHWGFKGIKGQMFFNMLAKTATTLEECDSELKAAISAPATDELAKSRIRTFSSYVKRLGEQFLESGGSKAGRPKPGSIPFFLSYFWHIQDSKRWPIYYTNTVNVLGDYNLWSPQDDLAEDYISFCSLHFELADLYSQHTGRPMSLYDVEHVFWFKNGDPWGLKHRLSDPPSDGADLPKRVSPIPSLPSSPPTERLPDSYAPPIVAIATRLAYRDPTIDQTAANSGISIERALEKSVHAAFTVLGYETKLLGQGMGRTPDGLAIAIDDSYAIMWDAKSRTDGYSMRTDDRTIREYVSTQGRELKRRGNIRNVYYAIISSAFRDKAEDSIRMMKMETDVSEVCLIEAAALVAIVETKLRDPLGITLGPDGLQQLFAESGVLTAEAVAELFG